MPGDMGIPSPAALALIGAGLCGLIVVSAYSSNFVEIEFYEVRGLGILGSTGTKVPGELCHYAKIIPLMCIAVIPNALIRDGPTGVLLLQVVAHSVQSAAHVWTKVEP